MYKKIAFINIKKVDGVNASTDEELKESYKNDGKYILKQIQLYKPAIIIAADTYDFFDDDYYDYCVDHMVSESDGFESRLIEKSKCLIRWNNEKILFDALHPNQRSVSQDIYCDTIIENYIRYRASHLQNTDY